MVKKLMGSLTLAMLLTANAQAQNTAKQIVKVDFDFFQRRLEEVHDPGQDSWVINDGKEDAKSCNNVSFKVKGNFTSKWYKFGMSAPLYNRLGSEG